MARLPDEQRIGATLIVDRTVQRPRSAAHLVIAENTSSTGERVGKSLDL